MYAMDIAKFMLCVVMGIMVINSINIFPADYIPSENSFISSYTMSNAANFELGENPSFTDYFMLTLTWVWNALFWLIQIILIPVTLLPWLISAFGIPPLIGNIIGVGIYVAIVVALLQWKRGASTEGFE